MKEIKQLVVPVSQQWIDWGIEGSSRRCMIQKATQETYPKLTRIRASKDYVRATDPKRNVIYTFPMSAFGRTMLLLFDEGNKKAIKPFVLKLRNPVVRERITRIDHKGRPRKDTRASQREAKKHLGAVPRHVMTDRVFGEKLWSAELAKIRDSLGISSLAPSGV